MITTRVPLQTWQRYRAITKVVCPSYSDHVLLKSTTLKKMSSVYAKTGIMARIQLHWGCVYFAMYKQFETVVP